MVLLKVRVVMVRVLDSVRVVVNCTVLVLVWSLVMVRDSRARVVMVRVERKVSVSVNCRVVVSVRMELKKRVMSVGVVVEMVRVVVLVAKHRLVVVCVLVSVFVRVMVQSARNRPTSTMANTSKMACILLRPVSRQSSALVLLYNRYRTISFPLIRCISSLLPIIRAAGPIGLQESRSVSRKKVENKG